MFFFSSCGFQPVIRGFFEVWHQIFKYTWHLLETLLFWSYLHFDVSQNFCFQIWVTQTLKGWEPLLCYTMPAVYQSLLSHRRRFTNAKILFFLLIDICSLLWTQLHTLFAIKPKKESLSLSFSLFFSSFLCDSFSLYHFLSIIFSICLKLFSFSSFISISN